MNWGALLQVVLNVFEKNPGLAENLLTSVLNLFTSNPSILTKAINIGLAKASSSIPAEHLVLPVIEKAV